jgi:hypothetical protein
VFGSALSRLASTQPAAPAPTITKSYVCSDMVGLHTSVHSSRFTASYRWTAARLALEPESKLWVTDGGTPADTVVSPGGA